MARTPVLAENQGGIALLEALVAILVFSLGILALVGLQASASKTATQAKFRIDAGQLATQRIADLWLDRVNLAGYNGVEDVSAVLPGGSRTTVIVGTVATVTVTWRAPGDTVDNAHQAVADVTTNP